MKRKALCDLCLVFLIAQLCLSTDAQTAVYRERRTIDSVLRSVADAFGYDIQKRPSLVPPVPTTQAPLVSTYFPPPVKPLPGLQPRLVPRASAAPPAAAPPPPPALGNPPKFPILPPLRPLPTPTPPKAPPPPPPPAPPAKAAPPPPPPPPPKAGQPPKAPAPAPAPSETFQKTFNLNFNWNKNVPQNQPAKPPAPGPPPPAPAPAKPPAAPPAPPPPPPAPPGALPPKPAPGHFAHKPQLYTEESPEHITYNDYNEPPSDSLTQLNDDYTEYQNQLNQDYGESNKNFATEPHEDDQLRAHENYKNSVNEFWQNYPLTVQHGYKYIAAPQTHEALSFPREFSKYEEYNIEPYKKKEACKKKGPKQAQVRQQDVRNEDEDRHQENQSYTRIHLLPRAQPQAHEEGEHGHEEDEKSSAAETIAHPLFSGILPAQLHQLASTESESKPWSIPFDYQSSGSEIKNKVVKSQPSGDVEDSSEDFDFYTVPEPKAVNLAAYEKLFTDEDDEGLSENAKIQTNEKSYKIHRTNKFENPTSW